MGRIFNQLSSSPSPPQLSYEMIENAENQLLIALHNFSPEMTLSDHLRLTIEDEDFQIDIYAEVDKFIIKPVFSLPENNISNSIFTFLFENLSAGQQIIQGYLISKLNSYNIITGFSNSESIWIIKIPNNSYFVITAENFNLKITQYLKNSEN